MTFIDLDVLQVITDTDRRGAQVVALDLQEGLTALGRRVQTVALTPGGSDGSLDVPTLGRIGLGPSTLLGLRRLARRAKVVIAHGSTTLPACGIALAGTGVPCVYRSIGEGLYWANTPARRLRVRLLLRRPGAIVALWPAAAEQLSGTFGVRPDRVRVIPQWASPEQFRPPSPAQRKEARRELGLGDGARVVVYVGALSPEKNVDAAIRAVAHLDGAVLVVAGDGPDRAALERSARASAPGRVLFVGSTANPERCLAAADVVVLPSRTEGMPAVLIEAAMMGLPVVATRVGAVPELVVDGVTGRIVPEDDFGELARAVEETLASANGPIARARERAVANFDVKRLVGEWDLLLGDVVSRRGDVGWSAPRIRL
jgi:glycosyltransferase involved in cell wall biosynthesis